MPESFARLIAKVAYCHLLCALDPGDFRPLCVPYILGQKTNPSYIVGGTLEIAKPEADKGYVINTFGFGTPDRLMLMAEVRLFANPGTPTYHVVVGDIIGREAIAFALTKVAPITMLGADDFVASPSGLDHWAPGVWPLPFWRD